MQQLKKTNVVVVKDETAIAIESWECEQSFEFTLIKEYSGSIFINT